MVKPKLDVAEVTAVIHQMADRIAAGHATLACQFGKPITRADRVGQVGLEMELRAAFLTDEKLWLVVEQLLIKLANLDDEHGRVEIAAKMLRLMQPVVRGLQTEVEYDVVKRQPGG